MTYDLNITFDDNLVTGNKTIDTQHKELIDRIQNFVIACQNGRPAVLLFLASNDFSGVVFVISEKSDPVMFLLEGVYGL